MKKNVSYVYMYCNRTTSKKYFYKTFSKLVNQVAGLTQDDFNEHKELVEVIRDFDIVSYYEYLLDDGSYVNEYEFGPNEDVTFIRGFGSSMECNFIIPKSKSLFWIETLDHMSKYIRNNNNFNVNVEYCMANTSTNAEYDNYADLISVYLTDNDGSGTGAMEFEFIYNIIFDPEVS